MPCIGSSNACPMNVVSAPWYVKPTGEGTCLSPQQFDSSTGHDQLFVPANMYTVSRLLFEGVVCV